MPRESGASRTDGGLSASGYLPGGQPVSVWQAQAAWYIDYTSGVDTAVGSQAAPIKTITQFNLRNQYRNTTPQTVRIVGNYGGSDARFEYLSDTFLGLTIQGAETIVLDNLSVTSTVAADPTGTGESTTITANAIPVSWTASGLVGKIGVIKSGARAGKRFVITDDLGAKTARVTLLADFAGNCVVPVAGDTFKVCSYSTVASLMVHSPLNDIEVLELEPAAYASVGMVISYGMKMSSYAAVAGQSFMSACYVGQIFGYADNACECYFTASLMEGLGPAFKGPGVFLVCANIISHVAVAWDSGLIFLTGSNGNGKAGIGFYGVASPIILQYNGILRQTSIPYGTGNTSAEGSVVVRYGGWYQLGSADRPNVLGPANNWSIGGIAKTNAEVPFTNLVGGSRVTAAGAEPLYNYQTQLAADKAINAVALADIMSQAFTVAGTQSVEIEFSFSASLTALAGGWIRFSVQLDTVQKAGGSMSAPVAGLQIWDCGSIKALVAGVTDGAHTARVQWGSNAVGSAGTINANTVPNQEGAYLKVRVLAC